MYPWNAYSTAYAFHGNWSYLKYLQDVSLFVNNMAQKLHSNHHQHQMPLLKTGYWLSGRAMESWSSFHWYHQIQEVQSGDCSIQDSVSGRHHNCAVLLDILAYPMTNRFRYYQKWCCTSGSVSSVCRYFLLKLHWTVLKGVEIGIVINVVSGHSKIHCV